MLLQKLLQALAGVRTQDAAQVGPLQLIIAEHLLEARIPVLNHSLDIEDHERAPVRLQRIANPDRTDPSVAQLPLEAEHRVHRGGLFGELELAQKQHVVRVLRVDLGGAWGWGSAEAVDGDADRDARDRMV